VVSASVRRVLVLVGLLTGAVGAVWLFSASAAQADEVLSPTEHAVERTDALEGPGDAPEDTVEQTTGTVLGGDSAESAAETAATTESGGAVVPDEDPVPPAEPADPVESVDQDAEHLRAENPEAHELTATGDVTPEALVPDTADGDVVRHLNRAVDETAVEIGGLLLGATVPSGHEEPVREQVGDRGVPGGHGTEHAASATPVPEGTVSGFPFPASTGAASDVAAVDGDLSAQEPAADPAVTITMDTATASGGSVPAASAFLAATGSVLPESGLTQATRHVRHALPSAAEDEPTFAPD
jgi:hypothetical protein